MDTVEESLENYLIGNFERMDPNVIGVILAQLDPQSALRLCQTNKKFNEICQRIKALDRKALEFIAYEAPLSAPVRNLSDNIGLIRRGFKTVYTAIWNENEVFVPLEDVRFGAPVSIVEEFSISMVGLPPPTGTTVWAFVDTDAEDWNLPTTEIYGSLDELKLAWKSGSSSGMNRLIRMVEEQGDQPEDQLEILLDGKMTYSHIIREVVLP